MAVSNECWASKMHVRTKQTISNDRWVRGIAVRFLDNQLVSNPLIAIMAWGDSMQQLSLLYHWSMMAFHRQTMSRDRRL
jgi:hypothetical protein